MERQNLFSDTERNLLKCVARYYSEEKEAIYPFTDEDAFSNFADWLVDRSSMAELQEDMEKIMEKYHQIATAKNLDALDRSDRKAFKLADRIWGTEQRNRNRENVPDLSKYPFLSDLVDLANKARTSIIFKKDVLKTCIGKIDSSKLEALNDEWFELQEEYLNNQLLQVQEKKKKIEVSIDLLKNENDIVYEKNNIFSEVSKLILNALRRDEDSHPQCLCI